METFLLLLRLLFAGIFVLAGVAKFLDPEGSEKAFKEFGIPAPIAKPSSVLLSVAEVAIGLMFLSVDTAWYAAIAASALLLLFVGQMIYQMAKGNAPDCHCFGQLHSAPVGKVSLIRNVVFAAGSLFLFSRGAAGQGMSLADPRLDVMQLIFGVIFVALLVAVIFYLKKISGQQTEIMRRIELVELVARDGGAVERDTTHPHEGLPIGAVFPDFELRSLDGEPVRLADVRAAGLPTLFLFVSPTCNPCQGLVPEFDRWQDELAGKLDFVFVSNGTAEDNVEKFGSEKRILLQVMRELAERVKAHWTPTAILVDRNGRIASHATAGDVAIRELVAKIRTEGLNRDFNYFTNGHGHLHESKLGETAPRFSLTDIKGNEITSDYFKGRTTLVTFWSVTCPHCVNMMESLREWDRARGADDPSLLIFSDGDAETLRKFDLKSPVIIDEKFETSTGLGMSGTPSAVLVDEEGKIISETAMGAQDIWSLVGKNNK